MFDPGLQNRFLSAYNAGSLDATQTAHIEQNAGVAQLVERNLAKVEVESSRLFSRSRQQKGKPRLPFFIESAASDIVPARC